MPVGRVAAATAEKKAAKDTQKIAPPTASFQDLGVDGWLCDTLKAMQIKRPSEIQRACIPPALAGKDIIGGAKTGSGKTAAFALPILQKLSEDPYGVFALVLTPTRELAFQIAEQFRVLGKGIGLKDCIVVGGMDMTDQAVALAKRPHVIIATPGRLHDHILHSTGAVHLSRCKFLVMDEADMLLTPSFAPALSDILPMLPEKRQTLLFTATMTDSILAIRDAKEDPRKKPFVHLCDMSTSTVSTLDQYYMFVPSNVRTVYLAHILRSEEFKDKSIMIFCGKCENAQLTANILRQLGVRCTELHSHMSQQDRLASIGKFRTEIVKVLISTDVGSRGLDIPAVQAVINYHIPRDPTDYIHRVGRTARAGRGGMALSIISERDIQLIQNIEARINKKLEEYKVDENDVLKELSEVTTAKRKASMFMHDAENKAKQRKIRK
ncbi:P-loop containing nucleoside triphosphate hydrolase protein [Zychaea mexicana]|uniref:P-loop containing nucleoside triphosphate hydrolase protein n=1 Tax=Zychaea mexicana TaxID=64656 RepID=UPI0022FE8639|nr:P-loop containing nucleoside triphosphate hydrolase protein [Zychaea mexicana]KAI9496760.1 P-loop containing nucleoside triphosphate hydrolase protein [Zychaea mexicana]